MSVCALGVSRRKAPVTKHGDHQPPPPYTPLPSAPSPFLPGNAARCCCATLCHPQPLALCHSADVTIGGKHRRNFTVSVWEWLSVKPASGGRGLDALGEVRRHREQWDTVSPLTRETAPPFPFPFPVSRLAMPHPSTAGPLSTKAGHAKGMAPKQGMAYGGWTGSGGLQQGFFEQLGTTGKGVPPLCDKQRVPWHPVVFG